ncbi:MULTISPECIES: type II toxin-antitoxin system HicB family antitoxin [unclassified Sphingobium]|uniref:type II toxin-antitoxin system HicB family antitoxin n=1 Tax=unclassified Sphingobium TaxID=2611147 RepID=UPI0022241794|nr:MULTISPECIES: type II toxin-antitoxin system HicB family antitoxin [unclassified Sphingobium]MCW2395161.1 putative RNase H-like HicB family nuclease [Sphingobium sp. B8D3B]MCW2418675.1 putative RNase H-like HicB family nuclease [Sphingobium sp. B8D3C]
MASSRTRPLPRTRCRRQAGFETAKGRLDMNHYFALVQKDADSAFGVIFPDLPGCFSAVDDAGDVVPQAVDALALWFEDQDIVAPSSLDDIRARYADELAEGAYLVSVPHIRNGGKTKRVNLTMEQSMLDAIDTAARQQGITRSAFVAQAARLVIEQRV